MNLASRLLVPVFLSLCLLPEREVSAGCGSYGFHSPRPNYGFHYPRYGYGYGSPGYSYPSPYGASYGGYWDHPGSGGGYSPYGGGYYPAPYGGGCHRSHYGY